MSPLPKPAALAADLTSEQAAHIARADRAGELWCRTYAIFDSLLAKGLIVTLSRVQVSDRWVRLTDAGQALKAAMSQGAAA